ncbi:hypothetical protein [Inquilinus sp. Marseille-Q2685]|uniref:hypothetical protein n=1 Tax=Inquilinus sp. Marseille-Q2685 TaxID=2866581 RepID=UPI001CE4693D|nr:hypothetical protein [Inquilinus sp. Marseille-Q2685]
MRVAKTLLLGTVSVAIIAGAVIAFDLIGFAQLPAQAADSKKPAAAEAPKANEQAAQTQQQAAAAPAAQTSVFEDHAKQAKLGACANVLNVLGRGVAADAPYTVQTQWNSKAADAHTVESIVALAGDPSTEGQPAAGVVFTAPVGRSCEGALVRVTPVKATCQAVATQLVNQQKGQAGALGDLPLVSLPNGARVVLVPLDNNCVAMTSLRAAG